VGVVLPRGDGDGWTYCAHGHKHWGIYGAAGLLLRHADGAGQEWVLLQHRALWSHHGGTWGILGGARNRGETAVRAAAREAVEEAGVSPEGYVVVGEHVDDHGGWSYTTVVGRAAAAFAAPHLTAESLAVDWVSVDRMHDLPLHPGFAATWDTVREIG
jgi:8-oxo-dGTP pyrophosphatase MutT (NUDIX family)